MLMRIMLWAILAGSIVMGYFGYKTGSATNAAVGMGIIIVAAFAFFFIVKMLLHLGFFLIKILLIVGLIALVAVSGLKGCQYLMDSGRKVNSTNTEKLQQMEEKIATEPFWNRFASFFSFSNDSGSSKQHPIVKGKQLDIQQLKPQPLPKQISGQVTEVRSGYLFRMGPHFVKLYGIDAPDPRQTCLDKRGATYNCGHKSKLMLERLIFGKRLTCQIAGGDYRENYIATCKIQNTDVGVSMLTAGWAVADRNITSVYTPYEEQAHQKKMGLWAGKFVAPWQARAQNRILQQNALAKKSDEGFWGSLFK